MKKKSATLTDIANKLDIDVSTVSKALKNHSKISDATKEKVREEARKLNYRPNELATALVKGESNLIGVMVPHTDENFFASAIRGIEEVAKKHGYRIIIFQSHDNHQNEITNIETMYRTKVDGIIASHAMDTNNFDHYQNILDQGIPLVLFDRFNDSVESDVVAVDDFKGAYKAVVHLIEQGCENIVHLAGNLDVHIYKERFRGYRQALEDQGLTFNQSLVIESDLSISSGRRLASSLLERSPLPDAIFASGDYAALGVLQELKSRQIEIPEKVSIIGFSNEAFTSYVTPSITSVEQHSQKMGKIAAKLFLDHVSKDKENYADGLSQKTILSPELMIRESSMRQS